MPETNFYFETDVFNSLLKWKANLLIFTAATKVQRTLCNHRNILLTFIQVCQAFSFHSILGELTKKKRKGIRKLLKCLRFSIAKSLLKMREQALTLYKGVAHRAFCFGVILDVRLCALYKTIDTYIWVWNQFFSCV